jgi:hypothetical protein
MTTVDATSWARIEEALGAERQSTGLRIRELSDPHRLRL